jgi:hypothetical protein
METLLELPKLTISLGRTPEQPQDGQDYRDCV